MLRRLTVLTERYEEILRAYLRADDGQWLVTSEGRSGRVFFMRLRFEAAGRFTDALAAMLEEAAALENPVYRYSPQLMNLARDLRSAPIHGEDVKRLGEFLKFNATLNVEGYVTFRMADYAYRLDLTAYSLIKRLQLMT